MSRGNTNGAIHAGKCAGQKEGSPDPVRVSRLVLALVAIERMLQ